MCALTEGTSTVLYLAWWWINEPKHVAEFLVLITNICCVYWLNKLLYHDEGSRARLKKLRLCNESNVSCVLVQLVYGNNPVLYALLWQILKIHIFPTIFVHRMSYTLKMPLHRIEFLHSWHECFNTVFSCVNMLEGTNTYISSCKCIKSTIYRPTSWAALGIRCWSKKIAWFWAMSMPAARWLGSTNV